MKIAPRHGCKIPWKTIFIALFCFQLHYEDHFFTLKQLPCLTLQNNVWLHTAASGDIPHDFDLMNLSCRHRFHKISHPLFQEETVKKAVWKSRFQQFYFRTINNKTRQDKTLYIRLFDAAYIFFFLLLHLWFKYHIS